MSGFFTTLAYLNGILLSTLHGIHSWFHLSPGTAVHTIDFGFLFARLRNSFWKGLFFC